MADNSRELPRRPRGAFVQFIPPMSSSHQKKEGRKRLRCQTPLQRVRLARKKKRKEVRLCTDLSSGHHKRPLGS
jgi:hypothetical protein